MRLGAAEDVETTTNVYKTKSCFEKPYRCPHPKIEFYLYTRRTQKKPEKLNVLDSEAFYYTHFNRAHPTKIVIHGFGGGRHFSPSTDMREAYFKHGDYNIIIVDYSRAVKEPCLSQMEWAPRFGALCIAQLVKYISSHPRGIPPDSMHLIGYSVGAHIAGLIANHLKVFEIICARNLLFFIIQHSFNLFYYYFHVISELPWQPGEKLGRITGLDPTIFFYSTTNNTRDLDKSDAHFVDVLHTGAGILGQWSPSGKYEIHLFDLKWNEINCRRLLHCLFQVMLIFTSMVSMKISFYWFEME